MNNIKMKIVSIVISILVAVLIITLSITLPILFRPFYYGQIDSLELVDNTGLTYEQIKQAYDEMMDYCLGFSSEFSAGVLRFSEEGASHFTDVRVLFMIDFALIFICAAALIVIAVILKKKKLSPYKFMGRSASFWSVVSIGAVSSLIGIACAINFRQTFIFFHKIFFVGKTNWTFDPYTDPIIRLLPNQFFSNCAVLIFSCMLLCCAGILLYEFLPRRKRS